MGKRTEWKRPGEYIDPACIDAQHCEKAGTGCGKSMAAIVVPAIAGVHVRVCRVRTRLHPRRERRAMSRHRASHWRVLADLAGVPSGRFLRGRDRGIALTLVSEGWLKIPVSYASPTDDGWTQFVVTDDGRTALAEHQAEDSVPVR